MLWPKKNSCKEFDNEKKITSARNFPTLPPPPNNFSNGLSLSATNARVEVLIYETGYEISGVFLYFRFEI